MAEERCQGIRQVVFIVPARNEEKHLEACLRSIAAQNVECVQTSVTVVDNESTDRTADIAVRCGARVQRVKPSNAAGARNAGAQGQVADFIAFIDADCVLPDGWLGEGLRHLEDESIAGFGAAQAPAPLDAPWVERVWVAAITPRSTEGWERVDWLAAFNLLVRQADFTATGGFDENLETCEDSDFSSRLTKYGYLVRDYSHPVRHLGESRSIYEFFRRELWRSKGNFRSAWKRGALVQEFISLFLPVGFVLFGILTIVFLSAAVVYGGGWWWGVAGVMVLACAAGPLLLTIARLGRKQLVSTSALLSLYLVARGIGPFVPSKRVAKR